MHRERAAPHASIPFLISLGHAPTSTPMRRMVLRKCGRVDRWALSCDALRRHKDKCRARPNRTVSQGMTIRYNNTRWDLIPGQWLMMRFNRALFYFFAAFGAFILWSSFTSSAVQDKSATWRLIYSIVVLFGILAAALIAGMTVSALNMILSKGKGMVGEHQLEITEQVLKERTDFNCSMNTWDGMRGIKETGSFYFLFVTDNSAHIIPKKKPLCEGDLKIFIEEFKYTFKQASKTW